MTDSILTEARPHVNGKAPKRPARARKIAGEPKAPRKAPGVLAARLRTALTVGMGCGIPALSLSLSSTGGALLASGHTTLGVTCLGLCATVLAVSLSHLASAIRSITHSLPWQAWALAVAVDVTLVTCELTRVNGFEAWLVPVIMLGVTLASMILNVYAFLND